MPACFGHLVLAGSLHASMPALPGSLPYPFPRGRHGERTMGYTMKDVAERAGVSLSTVSHVLNKTRYTAPETESRVLRAVEELNFHVNAHARRLAMKQTDLVGLIVSEIANPFFPEIINGFQTAA